MFMLMRTKFSQQTVLLAIFLEQLGLGQAKARNQELHPCLAHRWQEPLYLLSTASQAQ